MRIGSIVMLAAALVFGVSAAFLAKFWLENQTPETVAVKERPAVPLRTVVVAKQSLRFGMQVTQAHLNEIEWPEGAIPKGAFAKVSDILKSGNKRLVLSAIAVNEPVLREKITGPGQRATLSALVAEGKTAVAISVNDVLGVAGFVLPGERVDILLTQSDTREIVGGKSKKSAHTDVLLQNVRVLAVDQITDDRIAKPSLAKTVTIEVGVAQAQKIALATSIGTLSLALRSAGSTEDNKARRVSLDDLNGTKKPGAPILADLFGGRDANARIIVTRAAEQEEYSVPREAVTQQ